MRFRSKLGEGPEMQWLDMWQHSKGIVERRPAQSEGFSARSEVKVPAAAAECARESISGGTTVRGASEKWELAHTLRVCSVSRTKGQPKQPRLNKYPAMGMRVISSPGAEKTIVGSGLSLWLRVGYRGNRLQGFKGVGKRVVLLLNRVI